MGQASIFYMCWAWSKRQKRRTWLKPFEVSIEMLRDAPFFARALKLELEISKRDLKRKTFPPAALFCKVDGKWMIKDWSLAVPYEKIAFPVQLPMQRRITVLVTVPHHAHRLAPHDKGARLFVQVLGVKMYEVPDVPIAELERMAK